MDIKTKYKEKGTPWRSLDITFDPKDYWDIQSLLAEVIHAALVDFKNSRRMGYPSCDEINSMEEWDEILDKMILAFRLIKEDDIQVWIDRKKEIRKGKKLFAEYFESLWD